MSSILKDKPVQVNREEILQNFLVYFQQVEEGETVTAYYSVKADFSVWPDLRNTLLAGYVGL
jgi:hypothetical protein